VLAYYCADEDQTVISVAHTDVVLIHARRPGAYRDEIEAIAKSLCVSH